MMIRNRQLVVTAALLGAAMTAAAQSADEQSPVNVHGTIRSKYEYQTEENEGRFEVRNARISVDGKLSPVISYKAEIDLCDEGKIKMLDAYTRLKPVRGLQFTMGQFRVPFTIDAHRSPHQQYFANRSFIAKQVGNVRDVGAALGYTLNAGFPIILEEDSSMVRASPIRKTSGPTASTSPPRRSSCFRADSTSRSPRRR